MSGVIPDPASLIRVKFPQYPCGVGRFLATSEK